MREQNIKVLVLNCTLKKSPTESNTNVLIQKAVELYKKQGATCEVVRVVDHNIKFGVTSDEGQGDEWPAILEKIKTSDILIMASPIWFGVRSSIAQMVIERLDGTYMEGDKTTGQYPLYNKVAGVMVTGNEDGAHNIVAHTLGNLMHLGCTIPPNSDTYWVGDAGPGPSYAEAGQKHLYTNRTVRYMVANTLALARLLKANPITTNLLQLDEEAKKESE